MKRASAAAQLRQRIGEGALDEVALDLFEGHLFEAGEVLARGRSAKSSGG